MNSFTVCINAVLPLFIIMAAGYCCRLCGMITRKNVETANRIVFKIFMPVLMFKNIYDSDISSAVNPKLIAFAFAGTLFLFFAGTAAAKRMTDDRDCVPVIAQDIFRSNMVILGLPIATALVPDGNAAAVSVLAAVISPEFNILAVLCLNLFGKEKIPLRKTVVNILKNPLIIGTAVGLLAAGLKVRLPDALYSSVKSMASVASPSLLFLLGAFIELSGFRSHLKELLLTTFIRLIAIPAVFLTIAFLIGFRGIEMAALISVFATSAAVSSFTMVQQIGGNVELAGNLVITTNALCCVTLFAWCMLFKSIGAI